MGNYAHVDELGFVSAEQTLDAASTHCFTRIPSKFYSSFNLLREPQDRPDIQQTSALTQGNLKLLDMRGVDTDAVQDHTDAGTWAELATQEGPRTVYLNGRETVECRLSTPQF